MLFVVRLHISTFFSFGDESLFMMLMRAESDCKPAREKKRKSFADKRGKSFVSFSLLIEVCFFVVAVAEAKVEILFLFFFRCVAVRSRRQTCSGGLV